MPNINLRVDSQRFVIVEIGRDNRRTAGFKWALVDLTEQVVIDIYNLFERAVEHQRELVDWFGPDREPSAPVIRLQIAIASRSVRN